MLMIATASRLLETARAHLISAEMMMQGLESKTMKAIKIDADIEISKKLAAHYDVILNVDAMDCDAVCNMVQTSHELVAECKAHETLTAKAVADEIRARRA